MDIALSPGQERVIRQLVEAGLFPSREAAVAKSLEWLERQAEKLEALREEIEKGIASSERGELYDLDDVIAELRAEQDAELGHDDPKN